jgi:hypothetical protein
MVSPSTETYAGGIGGSVAGVYVLLKSADSDFGLRALILSGDSSVSEILQREQRVKHHLAYERLSEFERSRWHCWVAAYRKDPSSAAGLLFVDWMSRNLNMAYLVPTRLVGRVLEFADVGFHGNIR